MKKIITILIFCAAAAVAAGCASTRPTQFYTLSPAAAPPAAPPAGWAVSVGPVSVPAAVDRPQIVLQTGPNQVFIAEFDRWAAPLRQDIARIVAENLAGMLGASQSAVFPQLTADEASHRVIIDILRFESQLNGSAILDARWTVTAPATGKTQNGRVKITEPVQGSGYAEIAAAHSRALEKLSVMISGTIRNMENGKP